MRSLRILSSVLATTLVLSLTVTDGPLALAQSVSDAEDQAADAAHRADAAAGLVDEAVAERDEIEQELAAAISRANDLSAQLSVVGAALDRTSEQLGYADVELAGIQSRIEVQAVDAYMTVLSSPTVSLVNSSSVEEALVASSVVEDVVANGKETVDELVVKKRDLESLKDEYLSEQTEFARLQEALHAEVKNLSALYARAESEVSAAIEAAQDADAEYRAALSAVDLARARESERRRQEGRNTTNTTSPPSTSPPTTSGTSPTTTAPNTTTSTSGGGGGPWNHPPAVEQWRPLVQQYFPAHRVEEALRILDCESNGDPNAYNPYSGASGLFQFLPSTWASTAPKAGWAGHSVFEPEPNVSSAAWLANRYEELGQYYWRAWSCRRVLN